MPRLRAALSRAFRGAVLAAAVAAAACASDDGEDLGVGTYLHNAQGYVEGGLYEQALAQFRRALEVDPDNSKALLGEATCLFWLGTGETPAAGRYIGEADARMDRLDPEDYGENAWKVRLTRGMIQARLAELWGRKAEAAAKRAESGDPAAAEAQKEAEGNASAREAAALEEFRAVLAAEDQPLARNNLTALFYLARQGALRAQTPEDYDEALGFFRRYEGEVEKSKGLWTEMKKREPDLAEVYEQKLRSAIRSEVQLRDIVANILFKRREHEASIAELDKVIALDPFRATAFLSRAQNHEELGRHGAAADDYRRFLKLTDLPATSPLVLEAHERMTRCEEKVRESLGK